MFYKNKNRCAWSLSNEKLLCLGSVQWVDYHTMCFLDKEVLKQLMLNIRYIDKVQAHHMLGHSTFPCTVSMGVTCQCRHGIDDAQWFESGGIRQ
jgi:hypothetical protein